MAAEPDIYKDLKKASKEELLEVLKWFYAQYPLSFNEGLRLGYIVGIGEGWGLVAPAWLREYREREQ